MNKSVGRGRPRNPESPNYKLIVSMYGEYVPQKDMTPFMRRCYKRCLKMYS